MFKRAQEKFRKAQPRNLCELRSQVLSSCQACSNFKAWAGSKSLARFRGSSSLGTQRRLGHKSCYSVSIFLANLRIGSKIKDIFRTHQTNEDTHVRIELNFAQIGIHKYRYTCTIKSPRISGLINAPHRQFQPAR